MSRRVTCLVIIALFLGVFTTIAGAWIIAANRPKGSGSIPISLANLFCVEEPEFVYHGGRMQSRCHEVLALTRQTRDQYNWWRSQGDPIRAPNAQLNELPSWTYLPVAPSQRQHVSNAFGWPRLALRGLVIEADRWNPADPTASTTRFADYKIFGHPDDPRTFALPLGIIWPGFLINTLTYTLAWFVLLFTAHRAIRALLTRRRLRRGVCLMCSYDLRGDHASGCPECGWNRAVSRTAPTNISSTPHSTR